MHGEGDAEFRRLDLPSLLDQRLSALPKHSSDLQERLIYPWRIEIMKSDCRL